MASFKKPKQANDLVNNRNLNDRLKTRIANEIAAYSVFSENSMDITRPGFSKSENTALGYAMKRMRDYGLLAMADDIGNVYGFNNDPKNGYMATGSHIDSVYNAGK